MDKNKQSMSDSEEVDLANTPENIRYISNLPPSELGEGGPGVVFDIPDDLTYNGLEINKVEWFGKYIYVWYTDSDGYIENIDLRAEEQDGKLVVNGYSPGLLTARESWVIMPDAPHAHSLRPIYKELMNLGVVFKDMKEYVDEVQI